MKKLTELKQYEELCEYLKGLYTQGLITKEIITEFRNHIQLIIDACSIELELSYKLTGKKASNEKKYLTQKKPKSETWKNAISNGQKQRWLKINDLLKKD